MTPIVFSFAKPSPESTVASARIANFLAETIQAKQVWDAEIAAVEPDVLFIVNGAFAFCKYLPELAVAIRRTPRIIWVQNDYTIVPPKSDGAAESPFRKAFVERKAAGLPDLDYWTTIERNATLTDQSRYINWNSLTFEPITSGGPVTSQSLLYYGAFRNKRVAYFDRFFKQSTHSICISSTSQKFRDRYATEPNLLFSDGLVREEFYNFLSTYAYGLYLEDAPSHGTFMSPANRFYEMLSAGLPMLFQRESVNMMAKAGYDVLPYVIYSTRELREWLPKRDEVAAAQRQAWSVFDYRSCLRDSVLSRYSELADPNVDLFL